MIRRGGLKGRVRALDGLARAACALVAALGATLSPAVLAAAQGEAGRGALRPFVHVLLAYAVAWIAILVWVWLIARRLRRLEDTGG